jgi:hypothetical protein
VSEPLWQSFIMTRNAYRAAHERLVDRFRADDLAPTDIAGDELVDWLGLLSATEDAARVQREMFERYCEGRIHARTAPLRPRP